MTRAEPTAPAAPSNAAPSTGALLRAIGTLAAPTALVSVLQVVAQLTETWLAARQGREALTAWAVVLPFGLVIQQMSTGAMGGGVIGAIARALGAGRREEASDLVLHAVLIALLAGSAFAVALAGFPRPILSAIAGPGVAEAAVPYATWLFGAGAIPVWLANTLGAVLRGGGRHALAARVLCATWVAYPLLAWLLAEPLGFGLRGLGMAVALAFGGASLAMAVVVLRGGAGFRPTLRLRPRRALFRRILAVGLVACLLASVANLTTILVTAQLSHFGPAAVAAYGISARLEFLMIPIAFGVGSALTALVGRSAGAGDWATARRTAWAGGTVAFLATVLAGALVATFPGPVARAFTADPEILALAGLALSTIGPAFGGLGLGMGLYFAAMGANRMTFPVLGALSRIGLATGLGPLLAPSLGIQGHFVAVACGLAAYGLVTAAGVRRGAWR